jgi:putative two-component system response regulator
MHLESQQQNQLLEERVQERTRALETTRSEVLERLATAAEYRDDATGEHTRRVGRIAGLLAERCGLPRGEIELITRAAPLHDVGKIGIPDSILLKPGKLTPDEAEIMKRHAPIGAAILRGGRSPLLAMAEAIALSHHERWDGAGYPAGLSREAIPLSARMVAIVDVFDALGHERPYRPAWPVCQVIDEIRSQKGAHFDPALTEAFLQLDHASLL